MAGFSDKTERDRAMRRSFTSLSESSNFSSREWEIEDDVFFVRVEQLRAHQPPQPDWLNSYRASASCRASRRRRLRGYEETECETAIVEMRVHGRDCSEPINIQLGRDCSEPVKTLPKVVDVLPPVIARRIGMMRCVSTSSL